MELKDDLGSHVAFPFWLLHFEESEEGSILENSSSNSTNTSSSSSMTRLIYDNSISRLEEIPLGFNKQKDLSSLSIPIIFNELYELYNNNIVNTIIPLNIANKKYFSSLSDESFLLANLINSTLSFRQTNSKTSSCLNTNDWITMVSRDKKYPFLNLESKLEYNFNNSIINPEDFTIKSILKSIELNKHNKNTYLLKENFDIYKERFLINPFLESFNTITCGKYMEKYVGDSNLFNTSRPFSNYIVFNGYEEEGKYLNIYFFNNYYNFLITRKYN